MHEVKLVTRLSEEMGGHTYLLSRGAPVILSSLDVRGASLEVSNFESTLKPTTYKLTLKAWEAGKDYLNTLLLEALADTRALERSYLEVDGWRLYGNVTNVDFSRLTDTSAIATLDYYVLYPVWRRYTTYNLTQDTASEIVTTGLDYPTDMPLDLAGTSHSALINSMVNSSQALARITFYGSCSNPYCRIISTNAKGETAINIYGVNAECSTGEKIIIDPTNKQTVGASVYRLGVYGERTNLYDKRRRGTAGSGSYVFETVKAGRLDISWPQLYDIDLELIEERDLLPWS